MDRQPTAAAENTDSPDRQISPATVSRRGGWWGIRARMLAGLVLVFPILITLWVVVWMYSNLEKHVIDPLARLVLWKGRQGIADTELPYWFETYAAPVIAILIALVLLYCMGFLARSRVRRAIDWALLRVPVFSVIYDAMRQVFQSLERQPGQQRAQRVVLITFPHPGMKAPAFVTATCKDSATQRDLLCVWIPTSPMPTSGFFLLVPKEEVTELNWSSEQALQAIISIGLTAPPQIRYFETGAAAAPQSAPA
jgi:uncharacterized membrane protein